MFYSGIMPRTRKWEISIKSPSFNIKFKDNILMLHKVYRLTTDFLVSIWTRLEPFFLKKPHWIWKADNFLNLFLLNVCHFSKLAEVFCKVEQLVEIVICHLPILRIFEKLNLGKSSQLMILLRNSNL